MVSYGKSSEFESNQLEQVIENAVDLVIVPNHLVFKSKAKDIHDKIRLLCDRPTKENFIDVRISFKDLVIAFSKIEMYRFGPSIKENNYERLFFWPDRRSRGLKQVQKILNSEDPSALKPESLYNKSVAVQGILALEYILFGKGSEVLENELTNFRCEYGKAVAHSIRRVANELYQDWSGSNNFGSRFKNPGPGNYYYRSHLESIVELLKSSKEIIHILRDQKILTSITNDDEKKPNPKTVPFWRSELLIVALISNLDSVIELIKISGISSTLSDENSYISAQLIQELETVKSVLSSSDFLGREWLIIIKEEQAVEKLKYIMAPLTGAIQLLSEEYPLALNISLGFNSRDGD
tara:strand:- start:528 stop:1583 length:1056 start_codon:yes stop_codon:yes gene_type:complete